MGNCRHASVKCTYARVVELVDTLALGASAFGRGGSSPLSRTKQRIDLMVGFLFGTPELEHHPGRGGETRKSAGRKETFR